MKKSLLFCGVAAFAFASCTQNEVLDVNENRAIGFDNAFINNGTRSIKDPSYSNTTLPDFTVYGYVYKTGTPGTNQTIFDGVQVSRQSDGSWKYDAQYTQYWVNGNTYVFGGIAPHGAGTVSMVSLGTDNVGMEVAFINNDTEQKDLLHAAPAKVAVSSDSYNEPVAMTFSHQLSKAKFSFLNSVGRGYTVKVKNVKITDAKSTGKLTISGESTTPNDWSDQGGTDLTLNFGNAVNNDATAETAVAIPNGDEYETYHEKLLIPTGSGVSYTVNFTTELLQGDVSLGTHEHEVTIRNVELKLGYCYDFKAVLTKDNVLDPTKPLSPITFTVNEFEGWTNAAEEEVPGYEIP